jgi:hypothetical protein
MCVASFISLDVEQRARFRRRQNANRPYWPGQQCIFGALFPPLSAAKRTGAISAQGVPLLQGFHRLHLIGQRLESRDIPRIEAGRTFHNIFRRKYRWSDIPLLRSSCFTELEVRQHWPVCRWGGQEVVSAYHRSLRERHRSLSHKEMHCRGCASRYRERKAKRSRHSSSPMTRDGCSPRFHRMYLTACCARSSRPPGPEPLDVMTTHSRIASTPSQRPLAPHTPLRLCILLSRQALPGRLVSRLLQPAWAAASLAQATPHHMSVFHLCSYPNFVNSGLGGLSSLVHVSLRQTTSGLHSSRHGKDATAIEDGPHTDRFTSQYSGAQEFPV